MRRVVTIIIAVVALIGLGASPASALPASGSSSHKVERLLGELWTAVLQTATPENPFGGGSDTCWELKHHVVSPFGPSGAPGCVVPRGTKILVVGATSECSTFETPNLTTEVDLRTCAIAAVGASVPRVVVDGRPIATTSVVTGLLRIKLPVDNLFSATGPDRKGLSVGAGSVALLNKLKPGQHVISIESAGSDPIITLISVA